MTVENAARICVDNEHRMVAGAEKNGVSGFRPNPIKRERFLAKFHRGLSEHPDLMIRRTAARGSLQMSSAFSPSGESSLRNEYKASHCGSGTRRMPSIVTRPDARRLRKARSTFVQAVFWVR